MPSKSQGQFVDGNLTQAVADDLKGSLLGQVLQIAGKSKSTIDNLVAQERTTDEIDSNCFLW